MEIMHQPITHLAVARFAGRIGNTDPSAGADTRTVAPGGGFDPGYETQNKQAGDDQSRRFY
jgi:hypothetical protein